MAFKKRGRVDDEGQQSRSEYELNENSFSSGPGVFSRASFGTLQSRKMVSAKRADRRSEYVRHVKALNHTFSVWFRAEIARDPGACLASGAQNWLDYRSRLEERYLRCHGEVLTFGSGDCGQLAHGMSDEHLMSVKFPRVVYSLRDKKVCVVACGGLHNAVVTEAGTVFTWGCADDGSLGRSGEESLPAVVEGLPEEDPVIGIACGDGQTVAVTTGGKVYGWGCYKDKEGKKWFNPSSGARDPASTIKRQENCAQRILGLDGIVEVDCGSSVNAALCDDGKVYSWGIGESGELGRIVSDVKPNGADAGYDFHVILQDHLTPAPMTTANGVPLSNARAIGCGAYHTLVVASDGLYTSGLSNYGQLGHGDTTNCSTLRLVDCAEFSYDKASGSADSVVAATGGMHHSLCLLSSGRVFSFGRSDYGQLGISRLSKGAASAAGAHLAIPEQVDSPWGSDLVTKVNSTQICYE